MALVRVVQRRVSIRSRRHRQPVPYFQGDEVHVNAKRAAELVAAGAVEYVDETDTTADEAEGDDLGELVLDALGAYLSVPNYPTGGDLQAKEDAVKKELGRRGYTADALDADDDGLPDATDADTETVEGDGDQEPVELTDAEKATLVERFGKLTLAKLDALAEANSLAFPDEAKTRKQRAQFLVDSGVTQ